ncbi:acetyl-CoA carboxylase biotin carboxylase subunit [Hoeflea prorocentri]|uniref:Acetyl-CoA carboxylase biotin carboxylase subunit n=1 Tax=Hoeflea prorocentri TaxID=1922333 RepID=A0A9X3UKZ0_9HYPH|nr:acetyl-CoA carboxylase biotin carboxylase subunit [Hoeflea prorocentri]MCY6382477.1 acetyl-CoA carboxylase biotin carboxylase subunit [Hoeflea prorocentri]MDA5400277.1 acetyl-CoA carboxylase biotin carboxylase subunit [Hoeflea prorocentri]
MAFDSILIANRGEIACRIIRTARSLGLRTIAVYSEADRGAPHTAMADEAVMIGPAPVGESYLRSDRIIEAAQASRAGAIHPGYGFLSENEAFAEAVDNAGLVFIGPPAKAIYLMGNKAEARRRMMEAGIACVPGYEDEDQSDAALADAAEEIGYPVMVKAAAGGGGRGMRLVHDAAQLDEALALARAEAASAFGSDELIIEKAVERPRHVEVQIFADAHGNVIHLGERDCSVQRRHQKVVEEAPCPVLTPPLRAEMGAAAVHAAKAVDYRGAGTVEFLLDASGAFYFLEMNTRLQVEHPVTELITGLDLVAMQIAVAQGSVLPLEQSDLKMEGHAIEVRLYAEDPARGFLPATGPVDLWRPASGEGIRIDAGIRNGQEITPYYDPMLAKIIAWGENREVARARLLRAVEETVLLGPATNTGFLANVLRQPSFADGEATTAFISETYGDDIRGDIPNGHNVALAASLFLEAEREAAFETAAYISRSQLGWSSAPLSPIPLQLTTESGTFEVSALNRRNVWSITVGDDLFAVEIAEKDGPALRARINGRTVDAVAVVHDTHLALAVGPQRLYFQRALAGQTDDMAGGGGRVLAPMPGLVVDLLVSEGQHVSKGEVLAVLEAMKMQHPITAPVDGTVERVGAAMGEQLGSGDLMIEITPEDL